MVGSWSVFEIEYCEKRHRGVRLGLAARDEDICQFKCFRSCGNLEANKNIMISKLCAIIPEGRGPSFCQEVVPSGEQSGSFAVPESQGSSPV